MDTLFVPISIDAMVVNDQVRYAGNFQRWQMDYNNLSQYASPMPEAFSENTASGWNNTPGANGVYLHWTLPQALRTGVQDSVAGQTNYPLVPNRWLVIRYNGPQNARTATAWVVESDYLDPNEGTSPYIDPTSTRELKVTSIGRQVDIATWTETGNNDLFLTAVGTGDVNFAAYQPYVDNVFSIHDPLTGIGTQDLLSYMVAGWYSDPSKDILSAVTDQSSFTQVLSSLNWGVDAAVAQPCNLSVYQGLCYGIKWEQAGPAPVSGMPSKATIAVGNTSADALTALVQQYAQSSPDIDTGLLEAFQYNLLPLLDQPNGQDLLHQAIHKAWFGTSQSGYVWVIVKTPAGGDNNPASVNWNDPNLDPAWLATLNKDQHAYDKAWLMLQSLQWNLYRMWWTKGAFDNVGPGNQNNLTGEDPRFTDAGFEHELDPERPDSLAWRVQQKNKEVADRLSKIPYGVTQQALQSSIQAYASAHQLPDGYQLKCYSTGSFYKANEPVVMIAGANATAQLTDENALQCRMAGQLITGLTYQSTQIDASSMQGQIPGVDLGNIPAAVTAGALLNEFFFLDPSDATMIATVALNNSGEATALNTQMTAHTGYTGTLPAITLNTWQQPWSPLFLMWTVMYYPIPYKENGTLNWEFNGNEYVLNSANMPNAPQDFVLSGVTLLTPQSAFTFKKRLQEFRNNHPDLDAKAVSALEGIISGTDKWDFISQTLDGFSQQLICLDTSSNVSPGPSDPTAALIGSNNTRVPVPGAVPQPFQGWPASNFQAFRSGQFCFEQLALVDKFGQSLDLTTSTTYEQLRPVISQDMTPQYTVLSQEPDRFIQLSPRILQPARLSFDYVSALNDRDIINLNSGINPVCAWILPNHMDTSLACYDPAGAYLGELLVITNAQATQVVYWNNAPLSQYTGLDEVAGTFPHLGQLLQALIAQGPAAFSNFYQVVDESLWLIDPSGARDNKNLSVLAGRPLALTRCRLKYELNGPVVTDHSWEYTFKEAWPEVTAYVFPVKLGQLKYRNDGLIGYFTGSDYNQFNCLHKPQNTSSYIKQIGAGNFIDLTLLTEEYVTMLVDPRASVHAITGILPVLVLDLPAQFVEPALDAMEVTFNVGPLLSTTTSVVSADNNTAVTMIMPQPADNTGAWSWIEQDGTGASAWNSYPVKQTDEKANMSNVSPVLRTGMLTLSGGE